MSNRQAVQEAPARKRSKRTCIHRWVLGEPIEGEIHGQCRLCDATRTYPANPEGNDPWGGKTSCGPPILMMQTS